jgi:hypothetical protein
VLHLRLGTGYHYHLPSSRVFDQDQLKCYFEEAGSRVIKPKIFVADIFLTV